jgi:hypothetical protein
MTAIDADLAIRGGSSQKEHGKARAGPTTPIRRSVLTVVLQE